MYRDSQYPDGVEQRDQTNRPDLLDWDPERPIRR